MMIKVALILAKQNLFAEDLCVLMAWSLSELRRFGCLTQMSIDLKCAK